MKFMVVLGFILSLLLATPVLAQEVPEGMNIHQELAKFPLASRLAIKRGGDLTNVVLDTTLVIAGNDLDRMELYTLVQVVNTFGVSGEDIVYDDTIIEHEGKSIWNYDLILIGGPKHNQITKRLMNEKYLEITTRDTNRPSFVIESIKGPEGKTVLVAGDIYGYEYDVKDLPVEPFIPEAAAATLAVITGIGTGAAAAVVTQSAARTATTTVKGKAGGFMDRLKDFLKGGGEEVGEEVISERDTAKKEEVKEGEKPGGLFGFTFTEFGIGIFSAIMFGIAYVWAETQSFSHVWVYIIAAGIAVIGHEFAHNVMAFQYNIDSKFEVWASGLGLVLVTSYLFGNVFATPGRSVLDVENVEKRVEGLIYSMGPLVNILIAIILIPFVSVTGSLGLLATVGIPMNLLVAIYNMLPVSPMDGISIKNWKLSVWILLFVPTFTIYFWNYVF